MIVCVILLINLLLAIAVIYLLIKIKASDKSVLANPEKEKIIIIKEQPNNSNDEANKLLISSLATLAATIIVAACLDD